MSKSETINTRSGLPLFVEINAKNEQIEARFNSSGGKNCLLHWGLRRPTDEEWQIPPQSSWPPGTKPFGQNAVQTPFADASDEAGAIIRVSLPATYTSLEFVLYFPDEKRWDNNDGRNYRIVLNSKGAPGTVSTTALADDIIQAETRTSWTLMHRFNLCYDLLDHAHNNLENLALLFVWLRFSAIRQLTWQRHYNTKPRELAHAQDRLTQKLAALYRSEPAARPLARLMLTTVGRGGEGQLIRDEILNIMHRHHIKEVSGHFMEEWHQKLHNNTTPDDVVICEAYLEFLRSNGNLDRFYDVLEDGGVTRQRLKSFERPIRTDPDFVPHLKDGLLRDFQGYLTILKASHSGTDLETAVNAARGLLDDPLEVQLDFLFLYCNDPALPVVDLVNRITDARRRLAALLHRSEGLRELLYLDLALEQLLRRAVERNIHLHLSGNQLADLIARTLENVSLSYADVELAACTRHWERLQTLPRFGADWSLHAKSVVDRTGRALGRRIDRFYQLLQSKAELLGRGFQAEPWTITLFSEEVVRGGSPGFVLSMLLHHLDPLLRSAADIHDWQIISRGRAAGRIEVVDSLLSIQRWTFAQPTVIVADKVTGDEEIPEGVTAVIAPGVVDVVSHVAVRARNANVLFASCHDAEMFQRLKSQHGKLIQLEVSPAGDVIVSEGAPTTSVAKPPPPAGKMALTQRSFTKYAVALAAFNEEIVGGKSCHQARLRGQLPDWLRLPASAALPFGVFEQVLSLGLNQSVAQRYAELVRQSDSGGAEALVALRETVLALAAPEELKTTLHGAMTDAGLAWPDDWGKAWQRIKQVWASKWNDRAFLSRKRMGIHHEDLFMAVLIQQVVPADYAFVIHTVNPSTGNANELFAEAVLGLGETLVGNHPGRAFGFVYDKMTGRQSLLSYPSKSIGLYGGGLIFRSDSNGEDLAGYAGAGLYDSVLLEPPRAVELDYTQMPLVWDQAFRQNLIATVARIGQEIERLSGSPQDIEGAVAQDAYFVVQTRPQVGSE